VARVSFFIDGFNLYHSLNNDQYKLFKWLNLRKLAELYLQKQDQVADVFYFTALVTWSYEKKKRHKLFIQANESFGVKTIYGNFKPRPQRCPICKKSYSVFEEKETDVNLAIELYRQACNNSYDTAVILSGDSDLIPAINAVKKKFPQKKVGILIPPDKKVDALKCVVDFPWKIKNRHLSASLLPDSINLADGSQILCPEQWKKSVIPTAI